MEQEHNAEVAPSRTGMSRRVVVKSAAWSVPVFATVGVTPAFAATGDPILRSITLSATRPVTAPYRIVNFTWTVAWAPDPGVPTTGSVSYSQPTDFAVTGPATLSGNTLTFTGENRQANVYTVPSFTISVQFTYRSQVRTASFTVGGFTVLRGETVNPVTVTSAQSNPIVTA